MGENPPQDPDPWRGVDDPRARLRRGLVELYAFYERTEDMLKRVVRDSEVHPLTRELFEMGARRRLGVIRTVLAERLPRRKRVQAALDLALAFHTRQRLNQSWLTREEPVATMVAAVLL